MSRTFLLVLTLNFVWMAAAAFAYTHFVSTACYYIGGLAYAWPFDWIAWCIRSLGVCFLGLALFFAVKLRLAFKRKRRLRGYHLRPSKGRRITDGFSNRQGR